MRKTLFSEICKERPNKAALGIFTTSVNRLKNRISNKLDTLPQGASIQKEVNIVDNSLNKMSAAERDIFKKKYGRGASSNIMVVENFLQAVGRLKN